jgi:hypothetical protein
MGNQQERYLSWLAGIIDGEGSIGFSVTDKPEGRILINPYVCVMNSDDGILQESKRIMDDLVKDSPDAKIRWCNVRNTSAKSYRSRVKCMCLRVDGRSVRYIVEPLIPYLYSIKRENAKAVIAYLDSRKNTLLLRDKTGRLQRQGYRQSEVDLVVSTRRTGRGKSPEAIRSASNIVAG